MTDYFVMAPDPSPEFCFVAGPRDELPHPHYPVDGISLGTTIYSYEFDMDADLPGTVVPDFIDNASAYPMVSAALKAFLEARSNSRIEFMPFKLRDHEGKLVDDELYIANVIGALDWVDRSATQGREDPVNEGRYMKITRLVFDDSLIDPAVDLFRLAIRPKYLVVRDDLKDALEDGGFRGLAFHRVGDKVKLR